MGDPVPGIHGNSGLPHPTATIRKCRFEKKNTVRHCFLYAIKNKAKQPWMITKSGQVVEKLELF